MKKVNRSSFRWLSEFEGKEYRVDLKNIIRDVRLDTGLKLNKEICGEVSDRLIDLAEGLLYNASIDGLLYEIVENDIYSVNWIYVAQELLKKYNKKGAGNGKSKR